MLCVWWEQKEIAYHTMIKPKATVKGDRNNSSIWTILYAENCQNTIMLLVIALPSFEIKWKYWNGIYHHTRLIRQTKTLQIFIGSAQWLIEWLAYTSQILKKCKIVWKIGFCLKTRCFIVAVLIHGLVRDDTSNKPSYYFS